VILKPFTLANIKAAVKAVLVGHYWTAVNSR